MIRIINALCLVCIVALVAVLYHIRYSAEAEARQLRRIEAGIIAAQDRRDMLDAEWSSLNDPRRLQELSQRYLSLGGVDPGQIVDMRPSELSAVPVLLQEAGQ